MFVLKENLNFWEIVTFKNQSSWVIQEMFLLHSSREIINFHIWDSRCSKVNVGFKRIISSTETMLRSSVLSKICLVQVISCSTNSLAMYREFFLDVWDQLFVCWRSAYREIDYLIWNLNLKSAHYSAHFTWVKVPGICYSVGRCWQVKTRELKDSVAVSV